MHFTIKHLPTGQRFDFELVHTSDCIPTTGRKGWFWYCPTPDPEGPTFATQAECQQHAMRWVRDYVLQQDMEAREEQDNAEYRDYLRQHRLDGRQLGVL